MARESKKGATSSHTIKAKGGCLQHNRRKYVSANVVPARTYLNQSWESEKIRNVKSIRTLERKAAKLYTEKVGQKCQKTFAPYKESVVVVKGDSTMEEAMAFAKAVEKQIPGVECVGIWLHKDEGHYKDKYVEGAEDFKCNYHAHFLWSSQNQNTGKAIPIKREDLRKMQDLAAEAFRMERGYSAVYTKREHIESGLYKIMKLQEESEKLSTAKAAKETTIDTIKAVGAHVVDAVTGKSKRKEEDLKAENLRMKAELAKKDQE